MEPSSTAFWVCSSKKKWSHYIGVPICPIPARWPRWIPWLMVSKATGRSSRKNRDTLPLSHPPSTMMTKAISVP